MIYTGLSSASKQMIQSGYRKSVEGINRIGARQLAIAINRNQKSVEGINRIGARHLATAINRNRKPLEEKYIASESMASGPERASVKY